jgi:hypothetical protein
MKVRVPIQREIFSLAIQDSVRDGVTQSSLVRGGVGLLGLGQGEVRIRTKPSSFYLPSSSSTCAK